MTAGYDGSIKINTKLNTKGFNSGIKQMDKGLSGLSASLKGTAIITILVLVARKIKDIGDVSIEAAMKLNNAMVGLKSIVEGQGGSFSKANKFIKEFISDGLVPATDAVTAYKNLAMRGYSTEQIEKTMISLKNASAFGRSAALSMGEAVRSATEGLRNENSILVDNSGVTKNVSMMWKDYAKSIGVGVNSLTKQQKIQAEVNGIMEETRFQTGDAAKIADNYSGQVMKLGFNFNNLKIAIGNALIPMARAVLPSINAIISALTRLANIFAQVSTAIFGRLADDQEKMADSGNAAAEAQTDLADATTEAGKAAKKALSSFDELNILTEGTADSAGSIADDLDLNIPEVETVGGELFGGVTVNPAIKKFFDEIKEDVSPYMDRLRKSVGRLSESFSNFKSSPGVQFILKWFKRLLKYLVTKAWASSITGLCGLLDILSGALDFLGGILTMVVGLLTGDFDMAFEGASQIVDGFWKMLEGLGGIIEAILIDLLGKDAVEGLKVFVGKWGVIIAGWWINYVSPWFTKERWLQLFDDVKAGISMGWKLINIAWNLNSIAWWAKTVTPWLSRWKWFRAMTGVKDGIVAGFKSALDEARVLFNKLIGWINGKANISWEGLNIGGKQLIDPGNVQLFNIPPIPKLATGAVIPPNSEFMAILGDQKSGRNIETPEGLLRQIFREESGNSEVLYALKDILTAIREGKVMVVDKQVFAKTVNSSQSSSFRKSGKTTIPI